MDRVKFEEHKEKDGWSESEDEDDDGDSLTNGMYCSASINCFPTKLLKVLVSGFSLPV